MPRLGLRAVVLALVLASVLPLVVLTVHDGFDERRHARERVGEEAAQLAAFASLRNQDLVDTGREVLATIAGLPSVRGSGWPGCSEQLAELLVLYPRFASLGVVNAAGDLRCTAIPVWQSFNFADRAWFQRVKAQQSFAVGDYQLGRITGRPTVVFGIPLLAGGDNLDGVAFAALDLHWLQQFAASARTYEEALLLVTDAGGRILAASPGTHAAVGGPVPPGPLLRLSAGARRRPVEATAFDGINRVFAFAPLGEGGQASSMVGVGIPTAGAYSRANGTLVRNLGLLAAIALLGVGGTFLAADRLINRPARAVVGAAERLAEGDLSARAGPPYGSGELGELSAAFDRMAAALSSREADIAQGHADREALEEQLQQGRRLESLGQFAGGIAHDFNNVLAVILNYADFVLSSLPEDAPPEVRTVIDGIRRDVTMIVRAGEKATALTRQLLIFARCDPAQPELIDLNVVVGELEPLLWLGENLQVGLSLEPDLWPVRGDRNRLDQILVSLAMNSRDAMGEGGILTVATKNVSLAAGAARGLGLVPGRYVLLTVADTGEGMPPEVMARAFDPFFTTKPEGRNAGLGLATVFGIVTDAGGNIALESTPGAGTSVRVHFPASSEVPPRAAPTSAVSQPATGETILVVEDEVSVREAAGRILTTAGYGVLPAPDANEALRICGDPTARVDLLLTDVVMPGLSGPELAQQARALRPRLRVIYMSGYPRRFLAGPHSAEDAEEVPDIVRKPFTAHALLQGVRRALDS